MNKYELYAVGHYFSEWPDGVSFKDFIAALRTGDVNDCWSVIEYEDIPFEDLAEMVESMAESLERTFGGSND